MIAEAAEDGEGEEEDTGAAEDSTGSLMSNCYLMTDNEHNHVRIFEEEVVVVSGCSCSFKRAYWDCDCTCAAFSAQRSSTLVISVISGLPRHFKLRL